MAGGVEPIGLIDAADLRWQQLSAQLSSIITDTTQSAWLAAPLEEWANESLRIALSTEVGYTAMRSGFKLGSDYQRRN